MGYYTQFTIDVEYPHGYDGEILRDVFSPTYGELRIGRELYEMKWYDHEREMIEFSKKHPNLEFILTGEGEERDDVWKKYFKNGILLRTDKVNLIMAPDAAIDLLAFRINSIVGGNHEAEIKQEIKKFLERAKW